MIKVRGQCILKFAFQIHANLIMLGQIRQTQCLWGLGYVGMRCMQTSPASYIKDGKSNKQEWYAPDAVKKLEPWNIPKPK